LPAIRVFLAGASGAIGRRLVPALIASGHDVTGTTRSSERAGAIADAGATPVLVDAFDAPALARAVAEARPDAVVNQLTALPQAPSPRGIKAAYAANNRARGEGGRNLLAATVHKRRYPIVGKGGGVHSFVHVDDAVAATVAALTARAGIYNVVDDDPAATSEWLPGFAAALGARPPLRVPHPVVAIAGGGALADWQESLEAADNERAKSVMGWTPVHATWRTGFRDP
jgi:nucleoside-diphosphate-sugar epimerase